MRKLKRESGVYAYLAQVQVTGGDAEAIRAAKKKYWALYKRMWRQNKKKSTRWYTVTLSEDEAEVIVQHAKRHKRSMPRFIKESCLAYVAKRYLVPDGQALGEIRQLLTHNFLALQKLMLENQIPYKHGVEALHKIERLEVEVLKQLQHPTESNNESYGH